MKEKGTHCNEKLEITVNFSLIESAYNGILYSLLQSKGEEESNGQGLFLANAWEFINKASYSEYICININAIHRARYITKTYSLHTTEEYLNFLSSIEDYSLPKPNVLSITLPNNISGNELYKLTADMPLLKRSTFIHNILMDYCQLKGDPYFIKLTSEAYLRELADLYVKEGDVTSVNAEIETNLSYGHLAGWDTETDFSSDFILAFLNSLSEPGNGELS